MPTQRDVTDAAISHQIGIVRYSNATVRKILALLNRASIDLEARIAKVNPETIRADRLKKQLDAIQELNAAAYTKMTDSLAAEIVAFYEYEIEYQIGQFASLGVNFDAPSARQVRSAALSRPFQGRLLREWGRDLEQQRFTRVRDALRMGFVEGKPIGDMVRQIRGTRANGFKDGLLEIDRRHAEAVVRTAINHTANYARQDLYEANSDIVSEWEYVATLDTRTTPICRALDGKRFKVGKGPTPPQHWNCRSSSVPVIEGFEDAKRAERDPATGKTIYVSATDNYGDWLRRQSVATQNDVLGVQKAKLFREGKLPIDKFVDNGRELTLAELRKREAAAWKRAGL